LITRRVTPQGRGKRRKKESSEEKEEESLTGRKEESRKKTKELVRERILDKRSDEEGSHSLLGKGGERRSRIPEIEGGEPRRTQEEEKGAVLTATKRPTSGSKQARELRRESRKEEKDRKEPS